MKNEIFRKTLIITIIFLFIGASVAPVIGGFSVNKNTSIIKVIDDSRETSLLTFYTFDKTKSRQANVVLSNEIAEEIACVVEDLKYNICLTRL